MNKRVSVRVFVFAVFVFFSWSPNVFALSGNGTSTYVTVFSGANSVTGFPNFIFDDSTLRLGILTTSPFSTLSVAGAPPQSTTSTLLLLDTKFITGGSASGTYIGANPPLFNGDFINFEVASSSKFRVASSGSLTVPNLTTTGLGYGVMVASGTTPVAIVAPGASGSVLTSNGSAWMSAAPAATSSMVAPFVFGEDTGAGKAVYMSDGSTSPLGFSPDTGGALTTNLVAYYKLEDTADSWSTYNLTNTGAVSFVNAKVNNGADHGPDNTSKRLEIANNLGITNGAMSVSLWNKFESELTSGARYIVVKGDGGTHVAYRFRYQIVASQPVLNWDRERGGVGNTPASYTVSLGTTWHHIVGTYDGTNLKLYLDNSLVASTTASGDGTAGEMNLLSTGTYGDGVTYAADGIVDEMGIWSKALSTTEVNDLYNGGAGQTMSAAGRTAGRVYGASAANHPYSDGFIGFAAATTTAGNTGNVVIGGLAMNVSTNLSAGKQYYLGNATGTISISPGTVTRKAGIGIATSTLLITNTW